MNRFLMRACAAATAGVALGMWVVTAASASGGGVPIRHGALSPADMVAGRGEALRLTREGHAIGGIAAAATSNRTFAGYEASVRAGSATVATASFTIPTLSCTTANRAIAPGAGVPANNYKTFSLAYLFTGCVNGNAAYFPGLVLNGKDTHYNTPFAAGDVITLTTKVSTNRTRVQVTDVTTGVTEKLLGAGARANGVFIGDDGLTDNSTGQLVHVPDFGKLAFKNCLIDGKALSGWHPHAYQRVNSRGTVQISTGAFWPGGTAFTTRYMHS